MKRMVVPEYPRCSWCSSLLTTRLERGEQRCAACLIALRGGRDWTLSPVETDALMRLLRIRRLRTQRLLDAAAYRLD